MAGSQTIISGKKVKHQLQRAGTLTRMAEGFGLVEISKGGDVEITSLGKKYYEARLNNKLIV
jgi:hypothetical protein